VLSKNIAWLTSTLAEATLVFTFITVLNPAQVLPQLLMYTTGYLAVALAGGVMGTWISITKPIKPPQQGMARRSPGGVMGLVAFLGIIVVAAAVVLAVVAVRALTPAPWHELASAVVTVLALLVSAVVWWIALDRNADVLELRREGMIDVLAKSTDA
jgi:hypothetical protein